MRRLVVLILCAAASRCVETAHGQEHEHGMQEMSPAQTAIRGDSTRDENLPASEGWATSALNNSPRHGEYFDVPLEGSATPIHTWVVYPERKTKAPVVLVIHEIFGLSDWVRALGDQLAREGFIAVVPDLISGFGPNGGGSAEAGSRDAVVRLVGKVTPEETYKRLNAVRTAAMKFPSASGMVGTVGFCWGGGRSFSYAVVQPELKAAVVYYGVSPDSAMLSAVKAPVLGLYGGDDARVDATVPGAQKEMNRLGKSFEVEIYDGAGHGFLRAQTGRDGANLRATQKAWPRTVEFLRKFLEVPSEH